MQWPQNLVQWTRLMPKIQKGLQFSKNTSVMFWEGSWTLWYLRLLICSNERQGKGSRRCWKALLYHQSKQVYSIYLSSWLTPCPRELIKICISRHQKCFVNYSINGKIYFLLCISHCLTSQRWSKLPVLNHKFFWPLNWAGNIVLSLFIEFQHCLLTFMHMGCMNIFPRGDVDRNNEQCKETCS